MKTASDWFNFFSDVYGLGFSNHMWLFANMKTFIIITIPKTTLQKSGKGIVSRWHSTCPLMDESETYCRIMQNLTDCAKSVFDAWLNLMNIITGEGISNPWFCRRERNLSSKELQNIKINVFRFQEIQNFILDICYSKRSN